MDTVGRAANVAARLALTREPGPRWPVGIVVLGLMALALGLPAAEGWAAALTFEWDGGGVGEWWRVLGCHFVHWSRDHLLWDVAVFVALGVACDEEQRGVMWGALSVAVVLIPLGVMGWQPEVGSYRGLSGLDSTLFVLMAVQLIRERAAVGEWRVAAGLGVLVVAFGAKVAYEFGTGETLFVDSEAFVPVPVAHLIGGGVGLVAGVGGVLWGPARTGAPTRDGQERQA